MANNTEHSLHGKVISYKEFKRTLPVRNSFLDAQECNKINKQIKNGEDILFLPTHLQEANMQDEKYQKAKYKIILYGIFTNGQKAIVVLDGISPYFEVRVPNDKTGMVKIKKRGKTDLITTDEYIENVKRLLEDEPDIKPIKTEIFEAKPFKYYQTHLNKFVRFYYDKLKSRKDAMKIIKENGYETTADDNNSYYRVVCRDYLTTFSSWAVLKNYKEETMDCFKETAYRLNIKNYKSYTGEMSLEKTPELLKDKTLSMTWDIETWAESHDVPQPNNPDDCMFCIGITLQWVNQDKPLLKIALVDYPSAPKPDFLTVVCGTEINLIKAFAEVFEKMQPEFIIGFNDSDYDWRWLVERAGQTKGLLGVMAKKMDLYVPYKQYSDAEIKKYNYKSEHIKLEATSYADGVSFMCNGYIPIDVRTVFRKLYPTAEQSSLKWFLEKNKLSGKEDMPYQTMFKIYTNLRKIRNMEGVSWYCENSTSDLDFTFDENVDEKIINEYHELKKQLADVNKYCIVDALRCHELMKIRSVFMDSREVGHMFYTSIYDSFYRANGMKVRNLTIATGQDKKLPFNTRFSNVTNLEFEEGKYPGAYVVPPKKGLQTTKLSIEERKFKAKLLNDKLLSNDKLNKDNTNNNIDNNNTNNTDAIIHPNLDYQWKFWLNVDDEQIQLFYKIIEEYGAHITDEEKIKEINVKYKNLPREFLDFIQEAIGRPITGLDFASLYPSLVMTYNLSPEYCILDKKVAREISETGQRITRICFDFNGQKKLAWFIWHNNEYEPCNKDGSFNPKFQFGVYPYILNKLFFIRKSIKNSMKKYNHEIEEIEKKDAVEKGYINTVKEHYDDLVFQKNYYNAKQTALKLCMNTFYGEAGNKMSPFFVLEVAGGITSQGVKNIKLAKEFVEKRGCNVLYGDSVAEYTPILIRNIRTNKQHYCEIKDLVLENTYTTHRDGKELAIVKDYEIWSDVGWTKIKYVVRHKTDKKMFRVLTHTSLIDVTEDHSLLNEKGEKVKPEGLVGTKLLLSKKPVLDTTENSRKISKDLAWVIGLFVAEGSCGEYNYELSNKSSWGLVNQDMNLLNKSKKILEIEYPTYTWQIYDCTASSAVYKLAPCNKIKGMIKKIVNDWRDMCYYGKSKIVPDCILKSNKEVQLEFLKGYYYGDGDKSSNKNTYDMDFNELSKRFDIKSQTSAMSFYSLCENLGYNVSLNCRNDKLDIYRLTITKNYQRKQASLVKKVMSLPKTSNYVYDIETGNHHFSAGVGDIVAHNTDSLYISAPRTEFDEIDKLYYTNKINKLDYWTKLVETTFTAIKVLNADVNSMFITDNGTSFLSMAYEEVLYPVAFTAKKKYYGIPHENIVNFFVKSLFIRGLEVKKRGVSELLKQIFNQIMFASVKVDNVYTLLELVLDKIEEIYKTKWEMKHFIQTAVYRPTKANVKVNTFVERMNLENIEVPKNERFNYVIVKKFPYKYDRRGRKAELSIGDKMEYVNVATDKGYDVDLDHYMKGSVNGQLARLIVYHEMFHMDPIDNSADELKIVEEKMYKNAVKYVDEYCKKFYTTYNNFGKTYQTIFKTANKILGGFIQDKDTLAHKLITANVGENITEWILETAEKDAIKIIGSYGLDFVNNKLKEIPKEERPEKIKMMQQVYYANKSKNIEAIRLKSFKETMKILTRRIDDNLEDFNKLYDLYNNGIINISDILKQKINITNVMIAKENDVKNFELEELLSSAVVDVNTKDNNVKNTDGVDNNNEDNNEDNNDNNEDNNVKPKKSKTVKKDVLNLLDKDTRNKMQKRAVEHASKLLDDDEMVNIICTFKTLYQDILSAYIGLKQTESIVTVLKCKRDVKNQMVVRPNDEYMDKLIKDDIATIANDIKDLKL